MSHLAPFIKNDFFTMGVELELQLINLFTFDLAIEADDFLRRLAEKISHEQIKPEITQAMIEINSSIHHTHDKLKKELESLRKTISQEAKKTHIGVCGGGTHPFQKWNRQRIFQTERFSTLSKEYGYLAKQFTIFGQHIHLGCQNGDDALYLCHALARYIPHFIALTASSPFQQGVDTLFECSRLAVVDAFPLSGMPPWILKWKDFEQYFDTLFGRGIVHSMKDFYWDIRPKPEFGTIEIRICDTPLTVEKAADIAAFAQILAYWLLEKRPSITEEIYHTYHINRFRATRFGFEARIFDGTSKEQILLAEDLIKTYDDIKPYAVILDCEIALENLRQATLQRVNGAHWLREKYREFDALEDVVRNQTTLWMCY